VCSEVLIKGIADANVTWFDYARRQGRVEYLNTGKMEGWKIKGNMERQSEAGFRSIIRLVWFDSFYIHVSTITAV